MVKKPTIKKLKVQAPPVEPERQCSCNDDVEIKRVVAHLITKLDNLYAAFGELASVTGTGHILHKYNIDKYKLTTDDLNKGKFK